MSSEPCFLFSQFLKQVCLHLWEIMLPASCLKCHLKGWEQAFAWHCCSWPHEIFMCQCIKDSYVPSCFNYPSREHAFTADDWFCSIMIQSSVDWQWHYMIKIWQCRSLLLPLLHNCNKSMACKLSMEKLWFVEWLLLACIHHFYLNLKFINYLYFKCLLLW